MPRGVPDSRGGRGPSIFSSEFRGVPRFFPWSLGGSLDFFPGGGGEGGPHFRYPLKNGPNFRSVKVDRHGKGNYGGHFVFNYSTKCPKMV